MCGICGIYEYKTQKPVDQQILDDMLQVLHHRGPDDAGAFLDRDLSMGMRRLSIIDLNGGKQPISNEDGTVVTVFNGEIYNYRSLREQLEGRGHVLATESDTEVIVHLYEEFGEQCVQHLRGMFGFAVWDKRKRQLLLARDRLGIKPLYYTQSGGRLIFGSEDRKSTRLNSSHTVISYAVFCLKKKNLEMKVAKQKLRSIASRCAGAMGY